MRTIFLLLFVSLFIWDVRAQQEQKFGEVSLDEVKASKYDKDSTTDAVVLYDFGETTFEVLANQIYIVFRYHGVVKILKKSALSRGSVSIPFYNGSGDRETVSEIKGFTHNLENGQLVKEKLTKDMIFNEKMSNDFNNTKFTMPKVREGSVIEYTYKISTPFSFDHNPRTWSFQMSVPAKWSEYRITIPNPFFYKIIMGGYLPLAVNERKEGNMQFGDASLNNTSYRFVVQDSPAFRDEPYITTASDYISKIEFELSQVDWPGYFTKSFSLNWNDLSKNLTESGSFGEALKKDGFLKDIGKDLKAKHPTDTLARIAAAVQYIQDNVKWNEKFSYRCDNLKKVIEKKEGDTGDMNLLLVALLRQAGLAASPVLLSTRGHGRVNESYALIKYFNNVVAQLVVGGKDRFIDASNKYIRTGVLPTYCLNQLGFLVNEDFNQSRLIEITPNESDRLFFKADLKINDESQLTGSVSKSYGGYGGWDMRTDIGSEGKDKMIENLKKKKTNWDIQKVDFNNIDDLSKSVEQALELKINDQITEAGNMIYLKPMLSEGYSENPFKQAERAFPVDFGHNIEETYLLNIEMPEGYSVVEAPKPIAIALPNGGGRFNYTVSVNGKVISLNSRLQLRKSLFYAEEYPGLKEFYDKIIAKQNEQIVLKK